MPTLQRRPSWVIREGAVGGLVIGADHVDRLARFQIVEREVDGAAAIVTGTLRRVGDENSLVFGRGVPENLVDVPGAVAVVDQQAVALLFQLAVSASE